MVVGDVIHLVIHAGGGKYTMVLHEGTSINERVLPEHSSFGARKMACSKNTRYEKGGQALAPKRH